MTLRAFIDDSGTHTNNSPVCVAAGYFGGLHYWKQFDIDWKRAIESRGLHEFHASRFWSGGFGGKTVGKYAGWTKESCENLLEELLEIIRRYRIWPVGSAVVVADWNTLTLEERSHLTGAVFENGKYKRGGAPTKPYFMAFLFAVQSVARYCDTTHTVDFVMDESRVLNGYAQQYFQEIKTSSYPHADKLGTIQPGDSRLIAGLQAADLLAYLTLRFARQNHTPSKELDRDAPLGKAAIKAREGERDFKLFNRTSFDILLTKFREATDEK